MKEIWINADPWKKELITTALESGADAVIVPPDKVRDVKDLGLITTVSEKGDLKWGQDVMLMEIKSSDDENEIVKQALKKKVVVKTTDWKVIPLENLVARTDNIFVEVKDLDEAKMAVGVLEKGVDGLIITERNPVKVKEMVNEIRSNKETLALTEFKIEKVVSLGMGDRVCVDTCTTMKPGEGMLVGNSSQGLFLIHSESIENPYVAPRPFRVNAGPVHAYVMASGGKTRYLSELRAGDEVMGVNSRGQIMPLLVGRVKIERRPLILIEASGPTGSFTTILQNAETIRLVGSGGEALSVVKVKPGDKALGYVEEAGRHFGHKIKETITEK
jgi:3-dehydroquinate synthase II